MMFPVRFRTAFPGIFHPASGQKNFAVARSGKIHTRIYNSFDFPNCKIAGMVIHYFYCIFFKYKTEL